MYAYACQQHRGMEADSFRYLPNTSKKVTVIKNEILLASETAALFTGSSATEQAFLQLGGHRTPSIVHFATDTDENGAFLSHLKFPSTTGCRDNDNPILRSNTYGGYWSNTPSPVQGLADYAVNFDITNAGMGDYYSGIGFSVRCVRNKY